MMLSMNKVQILCTHACNGKIRPVETVSGISGVKENDGGCEFKYDIL
jgi:hypothetical protein